MPGSHRAVLRYPNYRSGRLRSRVEPKRASKKLHFQFPLNPNPSLLEHPGASIGPAFRSGEFQPISNSPRLTHGPQLPAMRSFPFLSPKKNRILRPSPITQKNESGKFDRDNASFQPHARNIAAAIRCGRTPDLGNETPYSAKMALSRVSGLFSAYTASRIASFSPVIVGICPFTFGPMLRPHMVAGRDAAFLCHFPSL